MTIEQIKTLINGLKQSIMNAIGQAQEAKDVASDALSTSEQVQSVLSEKMDILNPVGVGSFSMGRQKGTTIGENSFAVGFFTEASGYGSHAEGNGTVASGYYSHAEGNGSEASGHTSHAEGQGCCAEGAHSHAEGEDTQALRYSSHAEGYNTQALEDYTHSEGNGTIASGGNAHAEGAHTVASGIGSHAEGGYTKAEELYTHTEGYSTYANGIYGHAEGNLTKSLGLSSHAEGDNTEASGSYSHAEGHRTIAEGVASHVEGQSNIPSKEYIHIVGNGDDTGDRRSNAHTLDWEGNAWFQGDVLVGSTSGTDRDEGSVRLAKITEVIPVPAKAEVGQTVRVSAVDKNGKPTAWKAVSTPELELVDTIQCYPDVSEYILARVSEYRNIVVDIKRTSNFEASGTLSLDIKSTTGLNRSYFGSITVPVWQHIQFRLNGTRPGVFTVYAHAVSNPYRPLPESSNSRVIGYTPEDVYALCTPDASKVFEGTETMYVYGERWQ